MKKSDHAEFAELSREVFGNPKAYKNLLKKGMTYIDKRGNIRVRKYSEAQLRATLVEAVRLKQEQEAKKLEDKDETPTTSTPTPSGD